MGQSFLTWMVNLSGLHSESQATVRSMLTDWLEPVLVPVIVILKIPVAAVALAVSVSVEVPGGFRELGVRVTVTPGGTPVTASVTKFVLPKLPPTIVRSKMFTVPSWLMSAIGS